MPDVRTTEAFAKEGKILDPADIKLICYSDGQRDVAFDDLTIREAREMDKRLDRELSNVATREQAIRTTRSQLRNIIGKRDD